MLIGGKVDCKGRPATKDKGGMRAAFPVLVTFAFENMANLVTYFNSVMHYDISDSATHLTNFMGTGYILSLLMACIVDAYFGRYKTVLIAAFLECLASLLVC
ncbi:NRT1/ PTR family 4.5-like protein [Tanacetum coccineum]